MGLFGQSATLKIVTDLSTQCAQLDYKLDLILKELQNMSTTQAEFDAALASFQTALTDGLTKISTALTDLVNKIQAGTPGVDLTNELTAVNQMVANVQAAVATATKDDPGPATPPATPAA